MTRSLNIHIAETINPITWVFGTSLWDAAISSVFLLLFGYFGYRWIVGPILDVLGGYWLFWRTRQAGMGFLEITPPHHIDKPPIATQELITVLQSQIGRGGLISLEVVSSRQDGIRYLIRAKHSALPAIQRHLASYLPDARFRVLDEDPILINTSAAYSAIYDVRQARHYAYPLSDQTDLTQSDPVAYVVGAMAKLQPGELATVQVVITPFSSYWASRIAGKILSHGYAIIDGKVRNFLLKHWWAWVVGLLIWSLSHIPDFTLSWMFILLVVSMFFVKRQEPPLTAGEQELYKSMLEKLGQPLFRTDIRLCVVADSVTRLNDLSSGLQSSLAPLGSPFQGLITSPNYLGQRGRDYLEFKFLRRLPAAWAPGRNILAASELASLYHFPFGDITTENLKRSHSRTLPAPLSLKQDNQYDIILGRNHHHGTSTDIGLTAADRQRHVYVIGGTGNGKTTLLNAAMMADLQNGQGFAFIDPHGDAAETLLRHVPEDRIKDIIYFNPDDLTHPIGLNLLELTDGLTGDDLLREKDLVTEAVISVFRKIFSDEDEGGHRIEYVLRNAVQTALTQPGATLFTVFDLLNDPKYRKQVVASLQDKDLINFWKQELGKAGDFQRVKMAAGITAKIGRFLFSASARRILEQPKSTINFDDILDSGKILICNFSKGLLGEDTSVLFGIMTLAKIQLAALRRARLAQAARRPFYLYVDEFQNFATTSFVQLLSEARKYQLFMMLAEQSTSQQQDQRTNQIILANVGTVICFRTGNPVDEKLLLPYFAPYIEPGEISNLPAYNFYMRINGTATQEPFSGETIPPAVQGDGDIARQVVRSSRDTYGRRPASNDAPSVTSAPTKATKTIRQPKRTPPAKNRPSATIGA